MLEIKYSGENADQSRTMPGMVPNAAVLLKFQMSLIRLASAAEKNRGTSPEPSVFSASEGELAELADRFRPNPPRAA